MPRRPHPSAELVPVAAKCERRPSLAVPLACHIGDQGRYRPDNHGHLDPSDELVVSELVVSALATWTHPPDTPDKGEVAAVWQLPRRLRRLGQ